MHLAFVQALPCKYTHSRSVAQRCWPQHVGRAYSYSPLPPLFFSSSSPCPFVLSFSTLPSSVRPASSTNSLHHLFPRSRPQSRPHSVRAQIRVNPLVVAEGGGCRCVPREALCRHIKEGGLHGPVTPLCLWQFTNQLSLRDPLFCGLWLQVVTALRIGIRGTIRPILCSRWRGLCYGLYNRGFKGHRIPLKERPEFMAIPSRAPLLCVVTDAM